MVSSGKLGVSSKDFFYGAIMLHKDLKNEIPIIYLLFTIYLVSNNEIVRLYT